MARQDLIKASVAYAKLANRIGVCRSTVYNWIDAGKFGQPVKIGRMVFVRREAVDAYIEQILGQSEKKLSIESRESMAS